MRCQLGLPRRSIGTNCSAPSRLYTLTLTMCTTTGMGEAKKRALFAVISGSVDQFGQAHGPGDDRDNAERDQPGRH